MSLLDRKTCGSCQTPITTRDYALGNSIVVCKECYEKSDRVSMYMHSSLEKLPFSKNSNEYSYPFLPYDAIKTIWNGNAIVENV